MKLFYENGLILTSVELRFKGKTRWIDSVAIDTGASLSILVVDKVDDIGIYFEPGDKLVSIVGIGGEEYCFSKKIDAIKLGDKSFSNVCIDFGNLNGFDINGFV
ncbi:hypothetical protein PB1_12949 [Bacillus methanolicus PB1]|uniref:Peptidase A2 domain-containing protein n=1 Tax=Bacillus methanolicus PB1 TaxID=997296 RepID=I3DW45_BACMT|nr:retropepsin-like aspartic protease [Bacillus methanolicus]EIJ78466.1 hypothetical protein PB1_12949 [Bacillus methanolicus PB1]